MLQEAGRPWLAAGGRVSLACCRRQGIPSLPLTCCAGCAVCFPVSTPQLCPGREDALPGAALIHAKLHFPRQLLGMSDWNCDLQVWNQKKGGDSGLLSLPNVSHTHCPSVSQAWAQRKERDPWSLVPLEQRKATESRMVQPSVGMTEHEKQAEEVFHLREWK